METKTKKFLILLSALGVVLSSYLSYIKLTHNELSCNLGECSEVQSSVYSEMFGIPVAVYGVGFYFLLLALVVMEKNSLLKWAIVWGILYSTYLTMIELLVIDAICAYCMGSFAIIILMSLLIFGGKNNAVSSG